jgi:hypothetical protein
LEKATLENEKLLLELSTLRGNPEEEISGTRLAYEKLEKEYLEFQSQTSVWKSSFNILLKFSLQVLKSEIPDDDEVKKILKKHFPSEKMYIVLNFRDIQENNDKLTQLMFPPIVQPAGSTRAPSTNSMARSYRRKRMGSDTNDDGALKPLETELRETRKYLSQMEDQLSTTKIMLQQTEAISEESSREISRLREQNDILREKLLTGNGDEMSEKQREIMSIKVLTDISVQTNHSDAEEYPVHIHNSEVKLSDIPVEKLTQELALATKAKVDLLKELSKQNKEYIMLI